MTDSLLAPGDVTLLGPPSDPQTIARLYATSTKSFCRSLAVDVACTDLRVELFDGASSRQGEHEQLVWSVQRSRGCVTI